MTGTSGGPRVPATLDARFAAHVVDTAVICTYLLADLLLVMMGGLGERVGIVIGLCVHPVYYIVFTWGNGQTLGRFIAGIAVVRTSGVRISLAYSARRYGGYLLSILTGGIGHLALALRVDRRALQDWVADTVVVQTAVRTPFQRMLLNGAAGAMSLVFVAVVGVSIFAPFRMTHDVERSREAATKGNLNSLIASIALYKAEHHGRLPRALSTDANSDFSRYLESVPPVKATHVRIGKGISESPSGADVFYTTDESITVKGRGWRYNPKTGHIFVNSCATDSKGVPYSSYDY